MGLKEILDAVRNQPDLKPHDGITYCNIAIDRILGLMGIPRIINPLTGQPHLANSMIDAFEHSPTRWGEVNGFMAHSCADMGVLAIAAQKADGHGHVAPVYPSEKMVYSPSWGKDVPYLSNVGRKNAIMRASQCFRGEPKYYAFRVQENICLAHERGEVGKGDGQV